MAVITLDLIEVADEWQELLESGDEGDESDDQKYRDLCSELGLTPLEPATLRWCAAMQNPTLIREDTFTDYAQEFAEDIWGEAARELSTYINWEGFANAMRGTDYYSVEYDGETWLRRA